jgi:hypothetical protein
MIGLSILNAEIIRDADTGIVTDTSSQLMWQDDAIGTDTTWQNAIERCETLTLGSYSDWRLPNINELKSIVDRSKVYPAIVTGFVNTSSSNFYWSSTTYENLKSYAWLVDFYYGRVGYDSKGNNLYVRCVRDGQ